MTTLITLSKLEIMERAIHSSIRAEGQYREFPVHAPTHWAAERAACAVRDDLEASGYLIVSKADYLDRYIAALEFVKSKYDAAAAYGMLHAVLIEAEMRLREQIERPSPGQ